MKEKRSKNQVLIVTMLMVCILVCSCGGNNGFKGKYSTIENESWCTVGDDGSYMKLDTNPYDKDDDEWDLDDIEIMKESSEWIKKINKELGFNDALMEKMNTTTWSQGKQTESNDKYTVSWTYHPDKGLEVMYEIKK